MDNPMSAVKGKLAAALAFSAWLAGVTAVCAAPLGEELLAPAAPRPAPRSRPESAPIPAVYTPRSVLYAARSLDGKLVATVEKGDAGYELWLHPTNTQQLPRLLRVSPVRMSSPAFNAAATLLAFADGRDDLKGDIWLLDLGKPDAEPRRLTGNDAGDAAPSFPAEAGYLLYQRQLPGAERREIVRLELSSGRSEPLPIAIDAAFATASPEGGRLAFVSRSRDTGGDLWLWDQKANRLLQITSGPARDLYPVWQDGETLLFTRFAPPAKDSATGPDGGVIFRLQLERKDADGLPVAFPLTSGLLSTVAPLPAGDQVLFVAGGAGGGQVMSLPASGELPDRADVAGQWQLARLILERQPGDPAMARLACLRVLAREQAPTREGALAALALAGLMEEAKDHLEAEASYAETARRYADFPAECALAEIARLRLQGARRCREVVVAGRRKAVVAEASHEMLRAASGKGRDAAARALIDGARLLAEFGSGAEDQLAAIAMYEKSAADAGADQELLAEAAYRRAALLARIEGGEGSVAALVEVAGKYDRQEQWAEAAIGEILEQLTFKAGDAPERLAALAEQYRSALPRLAMGAWNRVGDLAYRGDDWVRAKDAYRTVLEQFEPVATPTAAARFALAEILYREERFAEATALYEKEMTQHPEDAPLYQLARAAYIRKSLAAGESLYRLGELSAARSAFLDLIRYEGRSLEAHRGYIKSVAAQGQVAELLALYGAMLKSYPDDPVLLYAAGLCRTYLPVKESLEEGDRLIARASERMPASEYPFQTRGYIAEILETLHGERGGLERSLNFYRRAKLLNRPQEHPENSANLDLNIGNIAYLLGRNSMAWSHYSQRLAAGVPFDNTDTELLFQQRYAAASFQMHEKDAAISGYAGALKLNGSRLDTGRPLEQFGRLSRRVTERLFAGQRLSAAQEKGLREQQLVNAELELLGADKVDPPPSTAWQVFDASLRRLLQRERRLIDAASGGNPERAKHVVELQAMLSGVERDLDTVPRLVETGAEIHDRLGLAYLDADRFALSRQHFDTSFQLNRDLGRTGNLAANRRSASLAAYREADQASGADRQRLLLAARDGFRDVLVLIDKYPPQQKAAPKRGGALVSVAANIALDKGGSTEAAFGFSPEQERRLAESYLARISADLGDTAGSDQMFKRLLERYPKKVESLAEADLFGVGLLTHRSAHLDYARGDRSAAAAGFRDATAITVKGGNTVGAMLNLVNWGMLIPSDAPSAGVEEFLKLEARTSVLVQSQRQTLPADAVARYGNDVGAILARLAAALPGDGTRQALLYRAVAHWDRVLSAALPESRRGEERSALRSRLAARLNRAAVLSSLGLDEAAQAGYTAALAEARSTASEASAWRALAALGRYDEALALLERLAPTAYDLARGELVQRFAPDLEALAQEDPEQAFALLERLSELERVQILSRSLLGLDDPATLAALRAASPRLAELERVGGELAKAAPQTEAAYLQLRRQQEQTVLDTLLGKELELLPPFYALAGTGLLRLAASAAVAADGGEEERARFQTLLAGFRKECGAGKGGRFCSVLTPQPVEAIDVMERLSGRTMLRLTRFSGDRFLLFTVGGKAGISAETLQRPAVAARLADPAAVAVYEEPELFASARVLTWGLSATHLLRSVDQRRPLRTQVLDPAGRWPAVSPFVKLPPNSLPASLPDAHTLALPGAAGLLPAVPNRPGEGGSLRAAWEDAAGGRYDFVSLAQAESVSLLLAPKGGLEQAYYLGHLAAVLGVPSLLVADQAAGELTPFALAYADQSLASAREELPAGWLLVGDWGADAAESAKLAKKQFTDSVKRGVKAHNEGAYSRALALFDNALMVASASPELGKHAAALHRHARESAFGAGLTERAVGHADALAKRVGKEKPYSAEHADALFRLGLLQGRLEQFKEATVSLKEGVAIFADLGLTKEQASALADFGAVMENAVDYPAARSLFEEAAGLRAQLKDEISLADQYRNLGRIADLRLNQFAVAERHYAKAQELYAKNGNAPLEAEAILDRGRCQRLLGNFSVADGLYGEALAKAGNTSHRTRMRIVLEQGNNAWFQGRYQEAFDLREQVEKAALKESWPLEQVMAKNTGGLIWWTLGDNKRALLELREALALAGKLEVRRDESATTLNNIGLVQRESGEYQGALETLGKALAIDRALGSRWAIAYDLRNLGQTRLKMGDPGGALTLLIEAAGLAESIGDRVNQAKIHLALGDARSRSNMSLPAEASYKKALQLADAMLLREVRWRALLGLARLQQVAGNSRGAVEAYRQALDTVEALRAEIRLDQLKDGFLADKMDVYTGLVGLLVDQGRDDEAFAVAERSRARNLIDILGRQRLSLSGAADQDLYDRQNRLKEQILEQEQLSLQSPGAAERAMYGQALEKLRADYQDLLLDIERLRPELLSLVKVSPLESRDVQALLEPGVALLSYYQLPDRLLCWRLEQGRSKLFQLKISARDLADKVSSYRRMLQNLEPLEKNSRELYDLLLAEPLAGMADLQSVGIVPHGSLHYLAFATLYDGSKYLIDRQLLFHLPAASVFRHSLSRRQAVKNQRILAIGNPDLGSASLDLPFAEKEAGTLRWNYSEVTTLTRERATESWVRENIGSFGIIHLASHGEFDTVNPLFSSIRLAQDAKADGRLQAEEVFGLDVKADLVVLSACQTGLGDVRSGDDVIGMNRAFLFAGTHALMSSLWRVSDVSSAILMKQFYRDYSRGNKAEALRLAMLHVRNRYPHPGYWGAFVLTGDYR